MIVQCLSFFKTITKWLETTAAMDVVHLSVYIPPLPGGNFIVED